MYYIHYHCRLKNGPADYSGTSKQTLEQAINACEALEVRAYVSELINMESPWKAGIRVQGFKTVYCNSK